MRHVKVVLEQTSEHSPDGRASKITWAPSLCPSYIVLSLTVTSHGFSFFRCGSPLLAMMSNDWPGCKFNRKMPGVYCRQWRNSVKQLYHLSWTEIDEERHLVISPELSCPAPRLQTPRPLGRRSLRYRSSWTWPPCPPPQRRPALTLNDVVRHHDKII